MKRAAAAAFALLGVLVSCADNSAAPASSKSASGAVTTASSDPTTTSSPATSAITEVASGATAPEVTAAPAAPPTTTWQKVTTSAECMCADGSPYSYWIHQGASDKVVFFLEGGGACFDAATCAYDSGIYRSKLGAADDPNGFSSGVFDFGDARNPLADYSFVFAPYCTGDAHLGDATHQYGPDLTIEHKGSVNASTALRALADQFPNTTQLVVTGESAGSIPTPVYAGMAHDLLPNAAITVLADGSGAYPDIPALNAAVGALWGTEAAIPPWPENAGMTAADWSFPDLFVQAAKHDPEIIFGRHDYAFDVVQQSFLGGVGVPAADLVTLIDANETQIELGGVDLRSYIAPGASHTVLSRVSFYAETVEGVPLVDWVTDLIRRKPDPDVHCAICTP